MAMTMTDPIADMLARLRNANSAYHDAVAMPHSKIKVFRMLSIWMQMGSTMRDRCQTLCDHIL